MTARRSSGFWKSMATLRTTHPFSFASCTGTLYGYCWTIIRRLFRFHHLLRCAKIYHELCKTLPWEFLCPWSVCGLEDDFRSVPLAHPPDVLLIFMKFGVPPKRLGTLLRSRKSIVISAVRFRSSASWRMKSGASGASHPGPRKCSQFSGDKQPNHAKS